MNILAIDPGTKCGYANGVEDSGTWYLRRKQYEGIGMLWLNFTKKLDEYRGVDLIAYEEVHRHLGTDAAHIYGGFIAHITAFCQSNNIRYTGVPVTTLKKHATGKGVADKKAMVTAALKKWKIGIVDDNHADALWIWDYINTLYGGTSEPV